MLTWKKLFQSFLLFFQVSSSGKCVCVRASVRSSVLVAISNRFSSSEKEEGAAVDIDTNTHQSSLFAHFAGASFFSFCSYTNFLLQKVCRHTSWLVHSHFSSAFSFFFLFSHSILCSMDQWTFFTST